MTFLLSDNLIKCSCIGKFNNVSNLTLFSNVNLSIIPHTNNSEFYQIICAVRTRIRDTINNTNISVSTSLAGNKAISLGKFIANSKDTIFHFSPTKALQANTRYYIIVKNTETSNNLVAHGDFYFTTGNYLNPTVSIVNPQNNATSISITTKIQINFSESVVNVTRATVHLRESSPHGIDWPLFPITQVPNAANNYLITPKEPLEYSTTYYLVLESGITDLSGNSLAQTVFQFTTVTAPTLYYTSAAMNYIQKCRINRFGSPENCVDSGAGQLFDPIAGITYNSSESMMYILNQNYTGTLPGSNTNQFMSQCQVNANGGFINCNDASALSPYLQYPGFTVVVNRMLYIFYMITANLNLNTSQFTECKIESGNNFFCLPVASNNASIFNGSVPYTLAINKTDTIAYVGLSNNTIAMCLIQNDGSFSDCSDSGAINVKNPARIWLNDANTYAYIYNFSIQNSPPSNLTVCAISAANTLTNCNYISQTLLNGLGVYYQPLYFNKYLDRLIFFNTVYTHQFTTLGVIDDGFLVFSQEIGDGTLNISSSTSGSEPGKLVETTVY